MHRTIDAGPGLLIIGSTLLVIGLFLPWYDGRTAWTVFESLDLVLAALAMAGALVGTSRLGAGDSRAPAVVALAALAVVVVQLVDPPPVVADGATLGAGAWLALAATLLMAGGAALTIARFTVTVDVHERDRRRRVAAVDRRAQPAEPVTEVQPVVDDQRTEAMSALDIEAAR